MRGSMEVVPQKLNIYLGALCSPLDNLQRAALSSAPDKISEISKLPMRPDHYFELIAEGLDAVAEVCQQSCAGEQQLNRLSEPSMRALIGNIVHFLSLRGALNGFRP